MYFYELIDEIKKGMDDAEKAWVAPYEEWVKEGNAARRIIENVVAFYPDEERAIQLISFAVSFLSEIAKERG